MALETTIGGGGDLFVGEDKVIRLELIDLSDNPVNMNNWTMIFDIRKSDTSAAPIVQKTPTLTGTFNTLRSSNTQRAVVTLTDDDLNLFKGQTYRYSWKRLDNDSETVLLFGDFILQKATAS